MADIAVQFTCTCMWNSPRCAPKIKLASSLAKGIQSMITIMIFVQNNVYIIVDNTSEVNATT